jgi:hypothetical protein
MTIETARYELSDVLRYKRAYLQMMVAHRSMKSGDQTATWRHRKAVAELELLGDLVPRDVQQRIENSIMPMFPEAYDA